MNVELSKRAIKQFRRLGESAKTQILTDMVDLEEDPPKGDIKKLKGGIADYRQRSGDYRIFFNKLSDKIVIEKILTRGQAYKNRR